MIGVHFGCVQPPPLVLPTRVPARADLNTPAPACVPARGRSRPFLSARSYLLPGRILGRPIHGLCTLIQVYPCSLFLGAIVRARLSSALIRRLSLSAVGVRLLFTPIPTYRPCAPLVVQSIGCVHSFGSAFVRAYTRFHSCLLAWIDKKNHVGIRNTQTEPL